MLIWQNLKEGDAAALGSIAESHFTSLLRYGITLGFDRETVKDAIQNTFVYIWEHRETIGEIQNGRAYLLFALRNRLMNEQKKTKKEITFWQRFLSEKKVQNSIDMDWIEMETELQNCQNIRHCIAQMPPREREVIQLRFYENLNNDAIAEIMGITKQGVANLLVRTLKGFRATWQEAVMLFSIGSLMVY